MTPEIIQINRLPSRATAYPYPGSQRLAQGNDREASPWFILSLDGEWDFHLAQKPEEVPADFIQPALRARENHKSWMKMPVPGNWTLNGTFDKPHYTNVQHALPGRAALACRKKIRRDVTGRPEACPRSWRDRRVVLHFGGAESVLYVYVNGKAVGMSKDSRLPSEFDITPLRHHRPGKCRLRPWSSSIPTPPSSRTRINGGWAGCIARFTSTRPRRFISPISSPSAISRIIIATGALSSPRRSAFPASPRRIGRLKRSFSIPKGKPVFRKPLQTPSFHVGPPRVRGRASRPSSTRSSKSRYFGPPTGPIFTASSSR